MVSRAVWKPIFIIILSGLSGCPMGGGGHSTPPTVTSTSPANGASDVARDVTVNATFSEDMFSTTINESSFILSNDEGSVSGFVSFDAMSNVASFTPAAELKILGHYTARLSSDITNLAGNPLAPVSWSFTIRDGAWGSAELIQSDGTKSAYSPQIAFDSNGNAIAVWHQSDGTRSNIWADRYEVGSGWGNAELIENDDAGGAYLPQIAFDATGNAIAVWHQSDGTSSSIRANRYVAGSGWGSAEIIRSYGGGLGEAHSPQIAMDPNGNAIAVWSELDVGYLHDDIWAKRYVAGSGWGSAEPIEDDDAGGAYGAHVAVDANGNAIAVWSQHDGTRYNVWSNHYRVGSGWGSAELIESDNAGDAGGDPPPQIAMDANGDAIAVWSQHDGTRWNIWANRYRAGSGWGSAELIESDDAGDAGGPQVAMDADGNTIAVWTQSDGTRWNIWTNRYGVGSGWGSAELIESDDAQSASEPDVVVDTRGNAIAVWRQSDGTRTNIRANRYVAGSSWGSAGLIESEGAGDASSPRIAVDANGNAITVWVQDVTLPGHIWTIGNIQTSRFD
jgi:hypothetical protein